MTDADQHISDQARPPIRGGLLYRSFGWLVLWMNNIGTLLILGLMAITNLDVLGRNITSTPLPGVIEMTEIGIVSIVFLQLGHTLRTGRFMRSDGFYNFLIVKVPRIGSILDVIYNLTGACLFAILVSAAFPRFVEAWEGDFYNGNEGSFTIATWPMELTIVIASVVMVIQFLILSGIAMLKILGRINIQTAEFETLEQD
jgi:TRAP-type mannitol/chloroaromatic compound transport system permease small subunit